MSILKYSNRKKSVHIVNGKSISPDAETVLTMLECKSDNPIYSQIMDIYNEQMPEICQLIKPSGAYAIGELLQKGDDEDLYPGREVIYVMSTLGNAVCEYIDRCMEEDMLKGLVVSFMADSCLFEFEKQLKDEIRNYCVNSKIGINRSYEAPDQIPMECQRDTWEVLDAGNTLGITMTGGCMLSPIKSGGHIYTISNNPLEFNLEHKCSECGMKKCPLRK